MVILKKKKVKLSNEDANTRRIPNSTSGMYLTDVKLSHCRQVAVNRREMEEAKKITVKKTATRNIHLQLKRYEAFGIFINSMNSLSLSTTN